MGLLDSLLGGSGRQMLEDFTSRHEKGMPIDDREASQHYERISGQLGRDDYLDAAKTSLERLSPDQRQQLLAELQQGARQSDVNFPGLHESSADPGELAGVMSRMHSEQPGLLQQLLGGGGRGTETERGGAGGGLASGMLGSAVGKAALLGIAAAAAKRFLGKPH